MGLMSRIYEEQKERGITPIDDVKRTKKPEKSEPGERFLRDANGEYHVVSIRGSSYPDSVDWAKVERYLAKDCPACGQKATQACKKLDGDEYSPFLIHVARHNVYAMECAERIKAEKEKEEREKGVDEAQRKMEQYQERRRFAYRYDPRLVECTCCKVEKGPCFTPGGKAKPEGEFHMVRRIKAFDQGYAVFKEGYEPDERPGPDNVQRH